MAAAPRGVDVRIVAARRERAETETWTEEARA
jgi:hypothetical protein